MVPKLPPTLGPVTPWPLRKGRKLYRIYDERFAPDSFNPCLGRPTRFAPISSKGTCIPSMYGASTFECAVFETIFHDVPAKAKVKVVPMSDITGRAYAELKLTRSLRLGTLFTPELKSLGLTRAQLIDVTAKWYPNTARWAEAIHEQYHDLDGLVWTSRQCDPNVAYLFYGDRVHPSDLAVVPTPISIGHSATLLKSIRAFGLRAGITIVS